MAHPERLYAACLELAGELCTFTGEGRRPVAYPIYRHDDLAGLRWRLIAGEVARVRNARHRDSADGVPLTVSFCIKLTIK